MVNHYDLGDLVTLQSIFYSGTAAIDPSTVDLSYKDPSGNITTVDINSLSTTGTGYYFYHVYADEMGIWNYRWYSSGTVIGAEEDKFVVDDSKFD